MWNRHQVEYSYAFRMGLEPIQPILLQQERTGRQIHPQSWGHGTCRRDHMVLSLRWRDSTPSSVENNNKKMGRLECFAIATMGLVYI